MNILTLKLRHFDAFKTVITRRKRKVSGHLQFPENVNDILT